MSILIIHPGSLGDLLLAGPSLNALRRGFPNKRLIWLVQPALLRLFHGTGLYDEGLSFDAGWVADLFSERPDWRSCPLTRIEAAVAWIGDPEGILSRRLKDLGANPLICAQPLSDPSPSHRSMLYGHSLRPLGITNGSDRWGLVFAEGTSKGRRLLDRWGISAPVVIHPGSGGRSKRTSLTHFVAIAERLCAEGREVILLEGPAEPGLAQRLAGRMNRSVRVVSGLDLETVAGLLSVSHGFVGNDSGISHLAAAVGIPTVAMFRRTDADRWGPRGRSVRLLQASEGCVKIEEAVRFLAASGLHPADGN